MAETAIVGLDMGISTTDVVGSWADGASVSLATTDPLATATEALRRFLDRTPPPRGRPLVVAASGVGCHRIAAGIGGLPVRRISEITAIGAGGTRLAGKTDALVASLGTGTAMVSVRGTQMRHVSPGTGIGGGSLLGIARALFGISDIASLAALASRGDRSRVDVTIGEVAGGGIGGLPPSATAANFAKWARDTRPEDAAAALANLIAEASITTCLLGLQASGHDRAILVGKLLLFEPIGRRFAEVAAALDGVLVIPPLGGVATALGAAWALEAGLGEDP